MSFQANAERWINRRTGAADIISSVNPQPSDAEEIVSSATLRGGAYLAARYGLGVFASVGNMLVMTRWIGPHAYGLFVTAVGLVAFLSSLARAGVDTYLVRCEVEPDERLYGVATTLIGSISVALTLAGAGITPLLIRWYGNREFVFPYLVLLAAIPVTGLAGIPMSGLERTLRFSSVAGIELGGQMLGLLLSALLAWSGRGVWAPVAGQIAWQVYVLLGTSLVARFVPRLRFDAKIARDMLAYGLGLTASLRAWQLRTLVNPLLVGRFAGAEGVAFVALALRLAEALGTLRLAAGRMAIATLARLQDRRENFRKALEQVIFLQVITLGPLLCAFSLVGPFLAHHVIGLRWMPSIEIFPFVAAGVLVNSVYNLQASALFVIKRQWIVMGSYCAHVVILGGATLLLAPRFGIIGYGWAELLACSAYLPIHVAMSQSVTLSYRRSLPLTATFLTILFAAS